MFSFCCYYYHCYWSLYVVLVPSLGRTRWASQVFSACRLIFVFPHFHQTLTWSTYWIFDVRVWYLCMFFLHCPSYRQFRPFAFVIKSPGAMLSFAHSEHRLLVCNSQVSWPLAQKKEWPWTVGWTRLPVLWAIVPESSRARKRAW